MLYNSDAMAENFAKQFQHLRILSIIRGSQQTTLASVISLVIQLPMLEDLSINGVSLEYSPLCTMPSVTNLRHLRLISCGRNLDISSTLSTILRAISTCSPHLESLHLCECSLVCQKTLEQIMQRCPKLSRVAITCWRRSPRFDSIPIDEHMIWRDSLKQLKLRMYSFTDKSIHTLTSRCPHMIDLQLAGVFTSQCIFSVASQCPRIESLVLNGCCGARTATVFPNMLNLATLCLQHGRVTASCLDNILMACPNLTLLDISYNKALFSSLSYTFIFLNFYF